MIVSTNIKNKIIEKLNSLSEKQLNDTFHFVNSFTETNLINKIVNDIKKTGFASEMKAIKKFNAKSWECSGNFNFFDKDEEITRESDLRASQSLTNKNFSDFEKLIRCFFYIVGEVKKTKNPWIIFKENIQETNTPKKYDAYDNCIFTRNLPFEKPRLVSYIHKFSLLDTLNFLGYGIHEFNKDPNQPSKWYSACTSICKAAEYVLTTEEEFYKQLSTKDINSKVSPNILTSSLLFTFIKPIVIIDGKLFSAELDQNSDIFVEEIYFAPLKFYFKTKNYKRSSYNIDIVTLEHLDSYLDISEKRHNSIFEGIEKENNQRSMG